MYLAIATVIIIVVGVDGNAVGAGSSACIDSTMAPAHYGATPPGDAPYGIELSATEYEASGSLTGIRYMHIVSFFVSEILYAS